MVFVNLPRMSLHSLNGNVSGTSYWKLLLGDGPLLNGGLLLGGTAGWVAGGGGRRGTVDLKLGAENKIK